MPKRKNPAAAAMGRRGAKARMTKLTARQRSEIAHKAAAARWAKVTREQPRDVCAVHEAGHMVMAFTVGLRFWWGTIRRVGKTGGHVRFCKSPKWAEPSSDRFNRRRADGLLEKKMRCSLGGEVAALIYRGGPLPSAAEVRDLIMSAPDVEEQRRIATILTLSSKWSPETQQAWYIWMFFRTWGDVARVWRAVTALASALLKRETIRYEEASVIVHNSMLARAGAG